MKPISIFTVTIARVNGDDSVTDVFSSEDEAIAFFLSLCAMNKMEFKKQNTFKNAVYSTLMIAKNKISHATISMYVL